MVLRSELDLAGGFKSPFRLIGNFDVLLLVFIAALIPAIEPDRRLQNQEDVVPGSLDFTDRLRDPVRLGKGIVDRVSQFLHQLFQWLFHRVLPYGGCAEPHRRFLTHGLSPPVPIVVDRPTVHKRNHPYYRQFTGGTVHPRSLRLRFCYDEVVWQRVAVHHGRVFVRHVVPAVIKPARTLWNDFIAFLFFCFGLIFGFKAARLAIDYFKAPPAGEMGPLVRLAIAGFCTCLMFWFAVGSYFRARKISRS